MIVICRLASLSRSRSLTTILLVKLFNPNLISFWVSEGETWSLYTFLHQYSECVLDSSPLLLGSWYFPSFLFNWILLWIPVTSNIRWTFFRNSNSTEAKQIPSVSPLRWIVPSESNRPANHSRRLRTVYSAPGTKNLSSRPSTYRRTRFCSSSTFLFTMLPVIKDSRLLLSW